MSAKYIFKYEKLSIVCQALDELNLGILAQLDGGGGEGVGAGVENDICSAVDQGVSWC